MTEYDNRNRGALWGNRDKQQENHPDFKGELDVDGRKYWVSAWKRREDASPKAPALSFSIKPKEDQPQREAPISQRAQAQVRRPDPISTGRPRHDDELDDQIPFAPEFR